MNVLVFESSVSGHRAYYTSVLTQELLRLGLEVTLALPQHALESDEGRVFLTDWMSECHTVLIEKVGGRASQKAKRRFSQLVELILRHKPQHAFVPYADGLSQVWGSLLRPNRAMRSDSDFEIEGLMMRGSFAYPALNWRQRLTSQLSFQALQRSGWSLIHQLDPLVYSKIKRTSPSMAARTRLIPEAIEPLAVTEHESARKELGISRDAVLITCPGMVDERKGCDLLIRAFSIVASKQPVQLLLLGKHSLRIRQLLKSEFRSLVDRDQIISRDRFATPSEFDSMFVAANLVAVPYPRHIGSSSILIRAALADTKVVASNWGWVGWATKKFQIGTTCDVHRSAIFAEAILEALAGPHGAEPNASKMSFLKFHSLDNHLAHWTDRIRQRMAIPASRMKFEPLEFACE